MLTDNEIKGLKKINRIHFFCSVPALSAFLFAIIYSIAGFADGEPRKVFNILFPGSLISMVLVVTHFIVTKCPRCKKTFYSKWYILGLGNTRRKSCQSCGIKLNSPKKSKKLYPDSTGDEW